MRRSQKDDEISKLFCKLISNRIWRFRQIFMAFSEYMNPIAVPYLISARFKSHQYENEDIPFANRFEMKSQLTGQ